MGNVLFADIYKVETWLCCLQNKQNLFHVRYVNVTYVPCTYVNLCKTIKKIRKSLLSTRNDDQVSEVHLELFQTPEMDIAQKKWRRFHRIWSHLLKKSLMENFIFRAVGVTEGMQNLSDHRFNKLYNLRVFIQNNRPLEKKQWFSRGVLTCVSDFHSN